MHGDAKESAEIDSEKEIVQVSTTQAVGKDRYGNIEQTGLQTALDNNAGEGKTEVIPDGENLIVLFKESDRYYKVDVNGNVEKIEIYEDTTPGELEGAGTDKEPFKIECIEDLVTFSIITNGGNTELGIKSSDFRNQYVTLERTLDFTSSFSYDDYSTTKYGDLNTDGIVEDIKTELTKKDEGCIGFTSVGYFCGIFDGKENEIKSIYQNVEANAGIFANLGEATIKNLTVSGYIKSTNYHCAGICASGGNTTIINCINKATIIQNGKISEINPKCGGIAGEMGNSNIINCHNEGKVEGDSQVGGIVGNITGNVINCYNLGEITGKQGYNYGASGGIAGALQNGGIYNCFNIGKIVNLSTGTDTRIYATAGGILGNSSQYASTVTVANVYNIGEVYSTRPDKQYYGAIIGGYWYNNSNICTTKNSYFLGNSVIVGYGGVSGTVEGITESTKGFMYSNDLVTKLNEYVENNENEINIAKLKRWKLGKEEYPIFE